MSLEFHFIRWRAESHGFGPRKSLIAALNHYGWIYASIGPGESRSKNFLFNFRVGPFGVAVFRNRRYR